MGATGLDTKKPDYTSYESTKKMTQQQQLTAPAKTDQEKEKTLVMSGPLGEVYTQALLIAFDKEKPLAEKLTLESMINDTALMSSLVKQATVMNPNQAAGTYQIEPYNAFNQGGVFAYAISQKDYTLEAMVQAVGELVTAVNNNPGAAAILVVDGMQTPIGTPQNTLRSPAQSLDELTEQFARRSGVDIATSFEGFCGLLETYRGKY